MKMKIVGYLALCICVTLTFISCNNIDETTVMGQPVYPKKIAYEDHASKRLVKKDNPVEEEFIESINNFSYRTALDIFKEQPHSMSYSPISLYTALSIVAIGANGETQEELLSILNVDDKDVNYLTQQNANLYRLLYTDNDIGKLKMANSLWLQQDYPFNKNFINNAVENFYTSLYSVDFSKKRTEKLMEKWIFDNTNGILEPSISLDKEQIMSIINTIYLKDEWVDSFLEGNTRPDTFHLEDGSEIKLDFMNTTYESHSFRKGEDFTSSSLHLKNLGSMVFILPDEDVSVDDLLSTPDKMAYLFDSEEETGKVIFKVPKFSLGSDLELKDILKGMGLQSVFSAHADFTCMTEGTAFISEIRQQSHIAIDENGVEATAFTMINYDGSARPEEEKIVEMILDKPFIFAIRSNDGLILFLGIVNNPADM